jgi:hypothetical protein
MGNTRKGIKESGGSVICKIYSYDKKQFPTGTWLEVKGLALKGQVIEIDMEAHKVK